MDTSQGAEKSRKKNQKIYKNPLNYKFNCECGKNFTYKKHYNDHRRKVHNDLTDSRTDPPVKPQKGCPLCNFKSKYRDEMVKHFETGHKISLAQDTLSFTTKDDFLTWKTKVERETASKYISENGSQAFRKHVITKYTCHRSGYYIPHKKKGIRHLKKQGSVKINGFCPANITLQLQNNGSCIVYFISTHVGHDNNLRHLSLTPAEREHIAMKLSEKVPFDEILENINKDTNCDSSMQRIHLLTRKDLYNIQASFNLSSKIVKHKNDAVSVDAWVKQIKTEGDYILYYKPQGSFTEETLELKSEDFVLIIMTIAQLDLLAKYGQDCICLNGTHGVNCYDFELNTLMVLDELREGFPCAFLITNRTDTQILSLFFSQIKLRVGVIKPKIFMSDLADTFFVAWNNVMGIPEKRLYCTWHVDHSWRENLSKIKTRQTQAMIYKHLRTLLTERDVNAFHKMLIQFCHIDDPDCLEFIVYFRNHFVNNSEYWAYCHRLHAGINTNMHLERMHKSINFIYLKEKRLEKGIAAIMRFVREKLNDVIKVNRKGKICGKLENIKARHKSMEEMDGSTMKTYDHGWEVLSDSGFEMYLVQKQEATCNNCQLTCDDCNVCIHQFVCTCLDSAIKYNMCKHIHLVAKFSEDNRLTERPVLDMGVDDYFDGVGDNDDDDNDDDGKDNNCETFLGELSSRSTIPDLDNRKERLIKSIIDTVNSITTIEELEVIENRFSAAHSLLAAMREPVSEPVPAKELPTTTAAVDLEQHLMGHKIKRFMINNDSEHPFVCSICMKGFKREGNLHAHFVSHSGDKKEICEECGRGFYKKEHLKKHARFHKLRRAKEEEDRAQEMPSSHPDINTRTAHVTISVGGAPNSQIQIPVQIPVPQHIQVPTSNKEENKHILSL